MRHSVSNNKMLKGMKAAFLMAGVLAAAGVAFYFGGASQMMKASAAGPAVRPAMTSNTFPDSLKALPDSPKALPDSPKARPGSLSLPMFFEPNEGQTDARVKFMARGSGYGLFLMGDEAVLELQQAVPNPRTATALPAAKTSALIRMRLEGASASAKVSGVSPLPGKSNYFIGNDSSKWRQNIPQFGRVEYQAVYPGVDLVYYGNQGQLEYDFRVAPGAGADQIALNFSGAKAHIVSSDAATAGAGDLVLSTANGDIRFHAPHVYQRNRSGQGEDVVEGRFRELAENKIGFAIGDYDHSRELVIDPVLSYSTYLGAGGGLVGESLVKVAVDSADNIYLAGSTTSAYFFPPTLPAGDPAPLQTCLGEPLDTTTCSASTAQNIFIAVINPTPQAGGPELLYATYLGGNGTDSLAGIAVDAARNIYVAGTTNSTDFPYSTGADGSIAPFQQKPYGGGGTHGFLSAIALNVPSVNNTYSLSYSTYLSADGIDTVTGMTIDNNSCNPTCDAYVAGVTTSTLGITNGFPANASGYQTTSNSPTNKQFFASKISTITSGSASMEYSTYFGGGNFGTTDIAIGGGIAVDPSSTNPNMYFTGTTNMLGTASGSLAAFPLFNAQQSCLNEASNRSCGPQSPTNTVDAFVAKINPNQPSSFPIYSTYLGGNGNDYGNAVAVDTSASAYVVGTTTSADWVSVGGGFQTSNQGLNGASNAFVVKISGAESGSSYPISYFTYLGGNGPDLGEDIKVDSTGNVYVAGTTSSTNPTLPVTTNTLQATYGGGNSDAFFAFLSTSLAGQAAGDYVSYLGGSGTDVGTGIAFDGFGSAYVAGATQSVNFPVTTATATTAAAYQADLIGTQDAFVSKIGAYSQLTLTVPNTSPSPSPVAAGNQVTFTFNINNLTGPDNANLLVFNATSIPTTGLTGTTHATVTSGAGSCGALEGSTISCNIQNLKVGATATVQVLMTPAIPVAIPNGTITISGNVSANGGGTIATVTQPTVQVVDFYLPKPTVLTPTITAGDTALIQVQFCPDPGEQYTASITPSQTTNPSMVTSTTPTFNPTTVSLSGTQCGTTTLSIPTVARPVTGASLRRSRNWYYATWLPIGGLSLIGLGIGATGKRRRWLIGAVLCLLVGIIVLEPGCGSASSSTPTTTGTAAEIYTITITGSAGTGASHQTSAVVQVN